MVLAGALSLGGCIVTSTITEHRLLREGQPIVEAIQAFHGEQHRFPEVLSELHLPPSAIDSRWHYFSTDDGRFGMDAYIGLGRICIRYENHPDNPEMTGWFRDNENGVQDWVRLNPDKH